MTFKTAAWAKNRKYGGTALTAVVLTLLALTIPARAGADLI
jgi:hypothetical protein